MPRTRPPYSPEFRCRMVELVRAGRDPVDLAREFKPTAQSICHWVALADHHECRREEKGPDWLSPSVMNSPGCVVRTSNCAWSAISSLGRRPGSHARPARSRPGLPVHEREPGHLPDRGDGARARRVGVGVSRLATTAGLGACHGRRRFVEARAHHSCRVARYLRRAPRACGAQGGWRSACSKAHRSTHATGRSGRGQPASIRSYDHPTRPGWATGAGSG